MNKKLTFLDITNTKSWLFLLIFISFLMRLTPIAWGIGLFWWDSYFHPDEGKIAVYVHKFPASFNVNKDFRYPTGLHHIISFFHAFYLIAAKTLQYDWLSLSQVTEKQRTFLFSRFIVVLMGTISVLYVYKTLKLLTNADFPAFIGAFSLNLIPLHVLHSALSTTDIPLSLISVLTVYIIMKNRKTNDEYSINYMMQLGLILGFGVAIKYTAIFLIISVICIVLWDHVHSKEIIEGLYRIVFILFIMLIVFAILMPEVILRPSDVATGIAYELKRVGNKELNLIHIYNQLHFCLGFPFFILLCFSIPLCLMNLRISFIPGLFIFLFFVVCSRGLLPRYITSIAPLFSVLIGLALSVDLNRKYLKNVRLYVFMFSIIISFVYCSNILYLRYFGDSRVKTAFYLLDNIPAESTIGLSQIGNYRKKHTWSLPVIKKHNMKIVNGFEWPDFLVLSSKYLYKIKKCLENPDLIHDKKFWKHFSKPNQQVLWYYHSVLNQETYVLLKQINPTSVFIEFKGYTYYIYVRKS